MAIVSKCKSCGKEFKPYLKKSNCCSPICYRRQYYIDNKETSNQRSIKWHQDNRERMNNFSRDSRKRHKIEVLNHYGGAICFICGVEDIEVLTLDHIKGGGTKQRRKFKDGHVEYAPFPLTIEEDYDMAILTNDEQVELQKFLQVLRDVNSNVGFMRSLIPWFRTWRSFEPADFAEEGSAALPPSEVVTILRDQ